MLNYFTLLFPGLTVPNNNTMVSPKVGHFFLTKLISFKIKTTTVITCQMFKKKKLQLSYKEIIFY